MRAFLMLAVLAITLLASPFAKAIVVPRNKAVQHADGIVLNTGRMTVDVNNGGVKMVMHMDVNSRITIDGKPGNIEGIKRGDFILYSYRTRNKKTICAEMTASSQPLTVVGRRRFIDTSDGTPTIPEGTILIVDKDGKNWLLRMAKSANIDIEGYGQVSFAILNRIYDRVPNPPEEVTCVYFVLGQGRYCTQLTDRKKRK